VLWICIALRNSWPRPGLKPYPLGPVASTLTPTQPRRLNGVLKNLPSLMTGKSKMALKIFLFKSVTLEHIKIKIIA
jgi:hypothetical protein